MDLREIFAELHRSEPAEPGDYTVEISGGRGRIIAGPFAGRTLMFGPLPAALEGCVVGVCIVEREWPKGSGRTTRLCRLSGKERQGVHA